MQQTNVTSKKLDFVLKDSLNISVSTESMQAHKLSEANNAESGNSGHDTKSKLKRYGSLNGSSGLGEQDKNVKGVGIMGEEKIYK